VIHIIRERATEGQMREMLQALDSYIKLAVDVERGILAGGGRMHADCESELLDNGSTQEDIWGADWLPDTQEVTYESFINIRPRQGNRTMVLRDQKLRDKIAGIAIAMLGGVSHE